MTAPQNAKPATMPKDVRRACFLEVDVAARKMRATSAPGAIVSNKAKTVKAQTLDVVTSSVRVLEIYPEQLPSLLKMQRVLYGPLTHVVPQR